MQETDIAIVGGGMAGSAAAAMLERLGLDAVLIDPHEVYPADFRCEKLDESQVRLLERTGLADEVLQVADRTDCIWICRNGRVVEKRPSKQYSAPYEVLVNAMRNAVRTVPVVADKVMAIDTSIDRQVITLSKSEPISTRLVVLANGLNRALKTSLGFGREEISATHSISIGFDVVPSGGEFPFKALTYYPEDLSHRIAYLTLFPFGEGTRANLFLYRELDDPWLAELRRAPKRTLCAAFPGLRNMIGDFEVPGKVQLRPADLYRTTNRQQDGVVLVGDAYSTSCPAAGTGLNKVFTDVERLCNGYVADWLATPGMSAGKIESFYTDRTKLVCEAWTLERAMLTRKVATENSMRWQARRAFRYAAQLAIGTVREMRNRSKVPLAGYARSGDPD